MLITQLHIYNIIIYNSNSSVVCRWYRLHMALSACS